MTRFKGIIVMAAMLGVLAFVSAPFSSAGEWDDIQRKIREAKTPADHQAIAAFYEKEAQEAHQRHTKHLAMRDAYAKIPVLREKGKADAHCETIAKKYQEMAKEYEALAAIHKNMAESAK